MTVSLNISWRRAIPAPRTHPAVAPLQFPPVLPISEPPHALGEATANTLGVLVNLVEQRADESTHVFRASVMSSTLLEEQRDPKLEQ